MHIKEFVNMDQFEAIMSNWATATGLATVAVDADGEYISKCYNFTDFCIKYTRGSKEGLKRCVKCDQEGHGVYSCHAGLIDFSIDLIVKGEKLGAVIGGQVLPEQPDEAAFRKVAREIGVDEETYISALNKVNVKTEESINAAANLLGQVLNEFINAEFERTYVRDIVVGLKDGVERTSAIVTDIMNSTKELKKIQNSQKILSLNANIEAARAGEHGRGFSIVASEVGKLSDNSSVVNERIEKLVNEISEVVGKLHDKEKFEMLMK
ncbi:MAG: PocR ligand-binding domain-containing protein [Lachnospiraceae bacterium]|nr:PocR ligand-binding domain-containing protein [Lachnospiraceae bacterium]